MVVRSAVPVTLLAGSAVRNGASAGERERGTMFGPYHITVNGEPIADAKAVSRRIAADVVAALRAERPRGKRFDIEPCTGQCWHPGALALVGAA